jgi:hypothetical protein
MLDERVHGYRAVVDRMHTRLVWSLWGVVVALVIVIAFALVVNVL